MKPPAAAPWFVRPGDRMADALGRLVHETYVYCLRDADRAPLYVGVTGDVRLRWSGHKNSQPWFSEVAEVEVLASFRSRVHALQVERETIKSLNPRYNINGHGTGSHQRPRYADLQASA